jgi:hypothetical protein
LDAFWENEASVCFLEGIPYFCFVSDNCCLTIEITISKSHTIAIKAKAPTIKRVLYKN